MNSAYNHGSQGDFFASLNFTSTPAGDGAVVVEDSKSTDTEGRKLDSESTSCEWPPAGPGEKLRLASRDGKIEELRILTANWGGNSAVINEGDVIGTTPLHTAVSNGHLECVKLLLDAGADKEQKNHYGQAPLHFAKEEGIVALLS